MSDVLIRSATAADYAAFAQLQPELATQDPVPTEAVWRQDYVADALVAERRGKVVGYLIGQTLADTGYVRNVVSARAVRRTGVGRALLLAFRERIVAEGKTSWRLNVKLDNTPAVKLYESFGMKFAWDSMAIRLAWADVTRLPESPRELQAHEVPAEADAEVERALNLPFGLVDSVRTKAGRVLKRLSHPGGKCAGFAAFDPAFPGAYPFAVALPLYARALFEALRPHARKGDPEIQVVADGDGGLAELLLKAGGVEKLRFAHFSGSLAASAAPR